MKKILITGGAGFIGSHLCEKLLQNNKIICVDNLYTGSIKNIEPLLNNKNFEFIKHDIVNPLYGYIVDEIYNLACPASPVHYQANSIYTTKISVIGSINMLNIARSLNCKILQASTSEVYGDPHEHPQKESYWGNVNPNGIRSCYDEGKRCAESLFMDYNRQYNIKTKIIRIFNTYGPNMDINDGRVVSNFIVQALQNKDITIYGDGSQTRSFQYIDDLINGIILMMNSNDNTIGPINLGNPNEFTIKQLAEKVIDLTNSKSKIIYLELPKDDPTQRKPDIYLAKEKLNWEPNIDLNTGLIKTIEFFNNKLKNV